MNLYAVARIAALALSSSLTIAGFVLAYRYVAGF